MQPHRLRPRFHIELPVSAAEAIGILQARLAEETCPCVGMVADLQLHFDLRMPPPERHLWSPALGGHFEARDEHSSILHGLIGPNPSAWTAVAFSYLACITGILFLLTLGGVQVFLGNYPWGFGGCAILLLFMGIAWVISQVGQRIAAPQTFVLRRFLEETFHLDPETLRRTERDPYHD